MSKAIATQADIDRGVAALLDLDPSLADVAARAGPVPLRMRSGGLRGLCAIIVAQQVSKASADAIFARLEAETDLDDANEVAGLSEEACRRAGLSRSKQTTVIALAEAVADRRLDLPRLAHLPPGTAIAELVAHKGIGVWTAECYLLFCIGHPDIFPAGDLALQVAVATALELDERPSPKQLGEIAVRWSPHRSIAARMFWAYYGDLTRRDAMPVAG
ncbi:DNA-3-methyladenine glycosylase family protein [Fulvimarina endophytica]|nr:DNA-3-methyladenine glycosylase 2 family protein [Fulvimarina endophytica]